MAIIKCKMCGGDLNLIEGASTAECEFCGSVQTIPNLDDEKKLIQFERAERLRKQCEFDKAAGIYETIVADFHQEAEAYWGLVLCKFGIEYVDDPATGKKIPTCHRSSFDSIMDDSDFEQALENADPAARKVYREDAKQIEEIRKGIIAVSNNEQPYDIFICYKETDEKGERTLDSVLAQDIYDALTDKGYRVFFARITLEDKLGMEYEPYIFAALNSAKIMLAIGTDYEYFNAVWVKNEWSRYLKLMAKDKDKHLIPCFKGIDAYDMPREFARLQAQDLGKVGAMQDLLRGIDKILRRQQQNTTVIHERVMVGGGGSNKIASLLDRGNMALEDGDWAKADSFFEDVLNNDSKNAQAYLGKTLVQEKCRTIDAFVRKRKEVSQAETTERLRIQPATDHIDQMVQQYSIPGYVGGQDVRDLYQFDLSYATTLPCRKKQYRQEETYWTEHKLLSKAEKFAAGAVAENLQREKKALFGALAERVKKAETAESVAKANVQQRYDSFVAQADQKAAKLYEDGLKAREGYYQTLLQTAKTSSDVKILTKTVQQFAELGDYQDSKNLVEHCRKRANEEQAKLDVQAEQQRKLQEQAREEQIKRKKIVATLLAVVGVGMIVLVIVFVQIVLPGRKYNNAIALMEAGDHNGAYIAFSSLGDYKDAKEKARQVAYSLGEKLLKTDKLAAAIAFGKASGYKDAISKSRELWDQFAKRKIIDVGCYYVVAVSDEGKILLNGRIIGEYESTLRNWDNLIAIAGGDWVTAGLREDGTVVAAGDQVDSVSSWENIVSIAAGNSAVAGLRMDGKVVCTDPNLNKVVSDWTDVIAIDMESSYILGLRIDGTVLCSNTYWDMSSLTDIIQIAAGDQHCAGLRSDGTVVAVGDGISGSAGGLRVENWRDIVSISAASFVTYGVKQDGTVVHTGGTSYNLHMPSAWENVESISSSYINVVCVHTDGTVSSITHEGQADMDHAKWSLYDSNVDY